MAIPTPEVAAELAAARDALALVRRSLRAARRVIEEHAGPAPPFGVADLIDAIATLADTTEALAALLDCEARP